MTNSAKQRALGLGFLATVVMYFVFSLITARRSSMMMATALFAHLPLFAAVFYTAFSAPQVNGDLVMKAIARGWVSFLASAVLWEICYHALYRRFNWTIPDLPGEVLFAPLFGWWPGAIVTGLAVLARWMVGRVFPFTEERQEHRRVGTHPPR